MKYYLNIRSVTRPKKKKKKLFTTNAVKLFMVSSKAV